MDRKDYVIWGSSGHAKVLVGIIGRLGGRVVATFDNDPGVLPLHDIPLHIGKAGFARWIESQENTAEIHALVAIGGSHGSDRVSILNQMVASGLKAEPLVDPRASVDRSAILGAGCQLLPGAIVSAGALLGTGCILNHNASVDHESQIGSGVHLAPGATVCGLVSIGDGAFVGSNATIPPRLKIGIGATVGAGAVVTSDVPDYAVVVGNPARIIRVEKPKKED